MRKSFLFMLWAIPLLVIGGTVVAQVTQPFSNQQFPNAIFDGNLNGNSLTDSTQPVELGSPDCSTSHSLTVGDTLNCADLEVNGIIFMDGGVGAQLATNSRFDLGGGSTADARIVPDASNGQLIFSVGTVADRQIVVCDTADATTAWGHAEEADPAVYVQSADQTQTDDFIKLQHNQTNGTIQAGNGAVAIISSGLLPAVLTADPCAGGNYPEGSLFYNDTSDYMCFCDGAGNDVQVHSPATACF